MTVDLRTELTAARVLAVIRGTDTAAAVASGLALLQEGVRVVEVALTTPGAPAAIEAIRTAAPAGSLVGAGTVLTRADVADVAAAGALTPTEAYTAMRMGAAVVKLFPASLGGPAYLKALRDPFPNIPFVAVGGVGLAEMAEYLRVGAIAVGVGGPLVGGAASGGDLDALRARARAYVAAAERPAGR